jgi:hypothetical protein
MGRPLSNLVLGVSNDPMNYSPASQTIQRGCPGFWLRSGGPGRAIKIVMVMGTTISSARRGDNGWKAELDPRAQSEKAASRREPIRGETGKDGPKAVSVGLTLGLQLGRQHNPMSTHPSEQPTTRHYQPRREHQRGRDPPQPSRSSAAMMTASPAACHSGLLLH